MRSSRPADRPVHLLTEYRATELPLSDATARLLLEVTQDRFIVRPSSSGGWLVDPQQYVGTVVLPGAELLVRPKAPIENVFLMLGVGVPPTAWRRETFAYGTTAGLLAAVAAFFARTCEQALARGLIRSYRVHEERLVALRGRVDLRAQFAQPGLAIPVACRFDDYTADVPENRIVKAALGRLLTVAGVPNDVRRALRRESARFEEVDAAGVLADVADDVHYTRLNRHYEPLVRLSALVLRNITLKDRAGPDDASAFLIDMNDLFQRFVTRELTRALRGRLTVEAEPTIRLDEGGTVSMAPDLVFSTPAGRVLVGDVKYKLAKTSQARSDDYYQLLAYTTAMGMPDGLLIYCATDSDRVAPGHIVVRHAGQKLHMAALSTQGTPADVSAAVAALADVIVALARRQANRLTSVAKPASAIAW